MGSPVPDNPTSVKRTGNFDPKSNQAWTLLAWRCGYSPGAMARAAGISLVQLRRLCLSHWGESLGSWLVGRRVVAAQQLLREDRPVKAVATTVGYRQVTHFSRHFVRSVGLSPKRYQTEFRRRWPHLR